MVDVDRARGTLLGLVCGDSLGATNENVHPLRVKNKIETMVGGGWLGIKPGEVTDDSEMAICIVDAILESSNSSSDASQVIPKIARNFITWMDSGPIDIGSTVSFSLSFVKKYGIKRAYEELKNSMPISNGSLMRTAPVSLVSMPYRDMANFSKMISNITHPNPSIALMCAGYNVAIAKMIRHEDNDKSLLDLVCSSIGECASYLPGNYESISKFVVGEIKTIAKCRIPVRLGIAVNCLSTAVKICDKNDNIRDTLLECANYGGDCDTLGAVCGGIAGAKYGSLSFPMEWKKLLCKDANWLVNASEALTKVSINI